MAGADAIDFDLIEEHKENIQSLPGGRSAKALARLYTPPLTHDSSTVNDAHNGRRAEFEAEIANIEDADDPLDVYDRYIRWTIDTYPSATTNAKSPLLPLLDRARQAFLGSSHYANDPRYLKIWLQHIHLFSDDPREAFVFIARHGIGETLAKFYEEFAAWLEAQNHWSQAEQIYKTGIEREARPTERLLRKFHDFERRQAAVSDDLKRPESPALPIVRAALAAKGDVADADGLQQTTGAAAPPKKKSNKMAIFSDAPQQPQSSVLGSQDPATWNIESLADRRRENAVEPKPWAGETLKVGKTNSGMGKMQIFKSSPPRQSNDTTPHVSQRITNPNTGKTERVVVWLKSLYMGDSDDPQEHCFEELRSYHRGWANRDWGAEKMQREEAVPANRSPMLQAKKPKRQGGFEIFDDQKAAPPAVSSAQENAPIDLGTSIKALLPQNENDENAMPSARPDVDIAAQRQREAALAKRLRREERANRTRKIEVMDVKQETQTVQLNLASPKGPTKVKRKKAPEPTMTITTREAMEEIYGIMSQPQEQPDDQTDGDDDESDSDDDDDEYTSGAESTTTGKLSIATSEYGEETQREILLAQGKADETVPTEQDEAVDVDAGEGEGWTDYGVAQHEIVARADQDVNAKQPHTSNKEKERLLIHQDQFTTPADQVPDSLHHMQDYQSPDEDENDQMQYRNAHTRSRLPFMTPIVEQTESSLGTLTGTSKRDYFTAKTPSRQTRETIEAIEEASDAEDTIELPFGKLTVQEQENKRRVLQPLRTKTTRGIVSLDTAAELRQPLAPVSTAPSQSRVSGPIIAESQCNPHEPSIRKAILNTRIAGMDGYHQHLDLSCKKSAELARYAKGVAKRGPGHDAGVLPRLDFLDSDSSYSVCRELGSGAFAPVYLVERQPTTPDLEGQQNNKCVGFAAGTSGSQSILREQFEALKVEATDLSSAGAGITSAWEFYMLKLTHERLDDTRAAESIIRVHEMHVFRDESFLVEQYRSQGTLLSLVNRAHELDGVGASTGTGLDESLAMFFTVELLRTIEALHERRIVHGDIKGDNVLLRLESTDPSAWTSAYQTDGNAGWTSKGVSLIDFGRSINMSAFRPDVQFIADWAVEPHDCIEMRECRPWTYQVDYHGLAGTVHMLLFGKYMDSVPDNRSSSSLGRTKVYRIRESLKRYWQTQLWGRLFDVLLNPTVQKQQQQRVETEDLDEELQDMVLPLPIVGTLRAVREDMQAYLVRNCEKGVGLRNMLRKVEEAVGSCSAAVNKRRK